MIDPSVLSQRVHDINPQVIEQSGKSSNETYPYRFWQSFSLSNWDFTVDFSVDCKIVSGGWELSSDISTSDGLVLAEFEKLSIASTLSSEEKECQISNWVKRLQEFLASNAQLIVKRLEEAKNR